jgi:hypothetical protein
MNYILDAKSVTRTKSGLLVFVVERVLWISGPGVVENDMLCHFLFPWSGGNRKTVSPTALTDVSGHTTKSKRSIEYSNLSSALRPVLELPVPERPESWSLEDDAEIDSDDREMDVDNMGLCTEYVLPNSENRHLETQAELNDIRDLNLPNNQAELLGFKLQGWDVLEKKRKKGRNTECFRFS